MVDAVYGFFLALSLLSFGQVNGALHRVLLLCADMATLRRLGGSIILSKGDLVIIFILRIWILFHLEIFDQETKAKLAAYTELRIHCKFTIVNIDDSFANVETHTYPLLILLTTILKFAKHFEQLDLICNSNSDTGINNLERYAFLLVVEITF